MGNLFSAFGFNQPFLIALAIIIIMLLVTAKLVGNDEPQKSNTTHRRNDTIPCVTIHDPLLVKTTTKSYRNMSLATN
uniref:Uncharacterized protein n=1 Tax=Onchocerca volvulus TaxID=6282 RepID=A0A2K6VUP0_ONCVO